MTEYDYQEVEPNKRFFEVLRQFSEDKRDPIHEWEFLPHIHNVRAERCICTTPIQNNFYIQHKRTKKQLIIGSECVKRWIHPKLQCKECDAPLGRVCERVRKQDFLCGKCKRRLKAEREEKIRKLGNYKLLFGKRYYQRLFKDIVEDIPYTEFLLNINIHPLPQTLQAFNDYCSLIFEIKETSVTQ